MSLELGNIRSKLVKNSSDLARHFLGFRHAVVDFFPETQSFRARLHSSDAPSAAGTRSMTGRFAVDATHVATAVLLPARESATT